MMVCCCRLLGWIQLSHFSLHRHLNRIPSMQLPSFAVKAKEHCARFSYETTDISGLSLEVTDLISIRVHTVAARAGSTRFIAFKCQRVITSRVTRTGLSRDLRDLRHTRLRTGNIVTSALDCPTGLTLGRHFSQISFVEPGRHGNGTERRALQALFKSRMQAWLVCISVLTGTFQFLSRGGGCQDRQPGETGQGGERKREMLWLV